MKLFEVVAQTKMTVKKESIFNTADKTVEK